MTLKIFFILLPWLLLGSAKAQHVSSTLLDETIKIDGFFVENDTIYAAEGWDGSRIFRITPEGSVSTICTGLDGPVDLVRRADGRFYVTEWNASRLAVISPSGEIEEYIETLPGPGPMIIDADGTVFFTHNVNDGSGFISKLDVTNTVSVVASGAPLINPGGLGKAPDGTFYVVNFNNANLIKIKPETEPEVIGTIESPGFWKTGQLAMNGFDIYITGISSHYIYHADTLGNITTLTGTGSAGHTDGTLTEAEFTNPNGIMYYAPKNRLYVGKAFETTNYLRRIDFGFANLPKAPVEDDWTITRLGDQRYSINLESKKPVKVEVHDTFGRLLLTDKAIAFPYQLELNQGHQIIFISLISNGQRSTKTIANIE